MLRFKMIKIQVKQFAMLKENPPQGNFSIALQTKVMHSIPGKAIAIDAIFRLNEETGETFLIIAVQCDFLIHPEDWNAHTAEKEVTIPKDTLDYFISQTVGVARGVLHCKTENTPFSDLVLPPMDVSKVIPEDMHIPID